MAKTEHAYPGVTDGVPDVAHARTNILECIVVTPEATAFEHPAQFVALPLYDGELGVAPGHAPLIGRLGFGELRLVEAGRTTRLYVDGGFVQVADDVVSILTPRAVPAEKLDPAVIREQLNVALQRTAHSPESMAARDRAIQQARGQLRVAGHAYGGAPPAGK
jgi:F-type H+-transporting ATPase subunit epsilon